MGKGLPNYYQCHGRHFSLLRRCPTIRPSEGFGRFVHPSRVAAIAFLFLPTVKYWVRAKTKTLAGVASVRLLCHTRQERAGYDCEHVRAVIDSLRGDDAEWRGGIASGGGQLIPPLIPVPFAFSVSIPCI